MNSDNTVSQVSLELCNSKRGQQLQIMAAMNENSVHFGKARPGILARKAGEVVHLLQGVSMKAWLRSDASGNCYSDIPIELKTHAGKMMNLFASPLSLIIQPTSLPINCSNTPVMFQAKDGDWFSVTENGLHPCQSPLKLTPHSFIWRNMDLGLNWPSPNTRDAKKLKALHHYQHLSTFQNTEKPNTTINQENKTESFSFLGRIRKLGRAARMKILEVLHGKSKIINSPVGRVLVAILALSLMPAIILILWLIIQLCAILLCLSHSLLISMAIM